MQLTERGRIFLPFARRIASAGHEAIVALDNARRFEEVTAALARLNARQDADEERMVDLHEVLDLDARLLEALLARAERYLQDPRLAFADATGDEPLYRDYAGYFLELQNIYLPEGDPYRLTADYVAGMTDQYALEQVRLLLWPEPIA